MRTTVSIAFHVAAALIAALIMCGCSTVTPPEPTGKVTFPPPRETSGKELLAMDESTGQLINFGHLRTVIRSVESVESQDGSSRTVEEIRPELERELATRDFRMFSSAVSPDTDIAKLSRETKAQLVLDVRASSRFVNSTGKFSKYRASGEIRAIRGRDGALLAVAKSEQVGPRSQNDERAGVMALRSITTNLASEIVAKLADKQSQLQWSGLIINRVNSAAQAQAILRALEASANVDYVELLDWNKDTREATYEIVYGLRHDSDLIDELNRIKGMKIRPSAYEPGNMSVFQSILSRYK